MDRPVTPDESDCCNSGCQPCIFDVYEKQLAKYLKGQKPDLENEGKNCLNRLKYTNFTLVNIGEHHKDALVYIFECTDQTEDCFVDYEPGEHCLIRMSGKNGLFTRAYTPIPHNLIANKRQFAILVKLYSPGQMSDCFRRLSLGSETSWRGPYEAPYKYRIEHRGLLMFAQGTGIAPLFAIVRKVLENEESETRLRLIYCCRTLGEIHLRVELYKLLDHWNFVYEVFLSAPNEMEEKFYKETVHEQRLSEEVIEFEVASTLYDRVLVCGSESFENSFKNLLSNCTKDVYYF